MTARTAEVWNQILVGCQVKPSVAAVWSGVFAEIINPARFNFSAGEAELDDFLGQVLVESAGLTQLKENLNYSAERLCVVWPKRFPTLESAQPCAHNPDALAEKVYGGRMGNVKPGDGARYLGRGLIMCTGADSYKLVGDAMGLDLLAHPDLLEQPHYALSAALAWWEKRVPDNVIGNVQRITEIVNGGHNALAERVSKTTLAEAAIEAAT